MDLLIKKPVAANSIVSFRLTSGEELVGKLVSDDGTTFVISKPIVIASQMTQKGIMIAFAPFMTSVDDAANFTFKHTHVSTSLIETREDVRTSYIEATTGLVTAPASSLIR